MKKLLILLLALLLTGCAEAAEGPVQRQETLPQATEAMVSAAESEEPLIYPDPQDLILVAVADYLPEVPVDLKYGTKDNFTGQVIYGFSTAYLRYGTVVKLAAVQKDLQELGYSLKIWDAFRPVAAQRKLWEVCPDSRYVADPNTGFSGHSRGNTVDVTLVDESGAEVEMPTGFDDFSKKADRDYSDCSQAAADNAMILQVLMEKHGFTGYKNEWWHFTDSVNYPVEEHFAPGT